MCDEKEYLDADDVCQLCGNMLDPLYGGCIIKDCPNCVAPWIYDYEGQEEEE